MNAIRSVLVLTFLLAASTPLFAADRPPNVILVFIDDK